MRNSILVLLVLLAGCQQSLQSKLKNNLINVKFLDIDTHINSDQRNLSDIWNKIRSKIVRAWEALKKLTDATKKHVEDYLRKVKEKINIIANNFEKKIENLKKDFRKIIENAVATGISVKKCLRDDKEVIETLLREILINVTTCISNNIIYLAKIDILQDSFDFDNSLFLSSVENKIKTSLKTCNEKNDQCLDTVKEKILTDIDMATWNVSQKALEVRNTIDDRLDTIVTCVTEGVTKASTSIVNETIQIIQCVKDKQ